jgi:hypothetical protein
MRRANACLCSEGRKASGAGTVGLDISSYGYWSLRIANAVRVMRLEIAGIDVSVTFTSQFKKIVALATFAPAEYHNSL